MDDRFSPLTEEVLGECFTPPREGLALPTPIESGAFVLDDFNHPSRETRAVLFSNLRLPCSGLPPLHFPSPSPQVLFQVHIPDVGAGEALICSIASFYEMRTLWPISSHQHTVNLPAKILKVCQSGLVTQYRLDAAHYCYRANALPPVTHPLPSLCFPKQQPRGEAGLAAESVGTELLSG